MLQSEATCGTAQVMLWCGGTFLDHEAATDFGVPGRDRGVGLGVWEWFRAEPKPRNDSDVGTERFGLVRASTVAFDSAFTDPAFTDPAFADPVGDQYRPER